MEVDFMGPTGLRWSVSRAALFSAGILILLPACPALASGEGGGVTVVPDWSVTLQIANFVFLIIVLNILLYRPIRRILGERRDKFKGMESDIQHADQTVQEKEAAFAKAIKDARARGLKEKETLVQQAEGEERKLIESINAKAQADLEEIRKKIRTDAERARQSLQQEIGSFANEITRKILGRAV
jgi:F-type H+-transporting ATPase subunit b